jgi:transcriptional regulator with XRE-family HTH domain
MSMGWQMTAAHTLDRPFGDRLRNARVASNHRLDDVAVMVRETLGYGPSRETIRRWEKGLESEDRVDPVVLAALAEIYGVTLESLSPAAERNASAILRLLRRHVDQDVPGDDDDLGWIGMGEAEGTHGRDADDLLAGGFGQSS